MTVQYIIKKLNLDQQTIKNNALSEGISCKSQKDGRKTCRTQCDKKKKKGRKCSLTVSKSCENLKKVAKMLRVWACELAEHITSSGKTMTLLTVNNLVHKARYKARAMKEETRYKW